MTDTENKNIQSLNNGDLKLVTGGAGVVVPVHHKDEDPRVYPPAPKPKGPGKENIIKTPLSSRR